MDRPASSASSAPPIDSPERRRLPPLLRRAWYGLNQAFRRRIAHTNVTPDQFTVLRILVEKGAEGITQTELAHAMTSDANTIASLLERMEIAGWISRRIHETDRRAHRIRLLRPGRSKYTAARQVALALQTEILSVLPPRRRELFLKELSSVAEACRLAAEKPAHTNAKNPG